MANYELKRVPFNGMELQVVQQNENGPCPLIAAANVLILRGQIKLPGSAPDVSQDRLMALVAEHLLDINLAVDDDSRYAADLRQNLQDVMAVLPKLATGVDVNPKFDSIKGFEFTNEIAIFDLMNISLVHGWLVDPADARHASALRHQSYNQVVSRLVAIMGARTPKHLLTPQSSFGSNAGVRPEAASRPQSKAGKGAAGEGEESAPLPERSGTPDLICFDDSPVEPSALVETATGLSHGREAMNGAWKESEQGENAVEEAARRVRQEGLQIVGQGSTDGDSAVAGIEAEIGPAASGDGSGSGDGAACQQDTVRPEDLEQDAQNIEFSSAAQEFLESASSQLTVYGLRQLHKGLSERELAVLFRNNHFNTLYKRGGALYILVTDQGYSSEEGVVWEKLDAVDGDTQYVTHDFLPFKKREPDVSMTDEDVDLQRALEASVAENAGPTAVGPPSSLPADFLAVPGDTRDNKQRPAPTPAPRRPTEDADFALALQLHEEMLMEQERERHQTQQQQLLQRRDAENSPLALGQPAPGIQYAFPPAPPQQRWQDHDIHGGGQTQAYGYPAPQRVPSRRASAGYQNRQGLVPPAMGAYPVQQSPQGAQAQQETSSPFGKMWHKLVGIFKRTS